MSSLNINTFDLRVGTLMVLPYDIDGKPAGRTLQFCCCQEGSCALVSIKWKWKWSMKCSHRDNTSLTNFHYSILERKKVLSPQKNNIKIQFVKYCIMELSSNNERLYWVYSIFFWIIIITVFISLSHCHTQDKYHCNDLCSYSFSEGG